MAAVVECGWSELRSALERPDLDRSLARDGGTVGPGLRGLAVGHVQDPEAADVLLAVEVGPSVRSSAPSRIRTTLAVVDGWRPPAKTQTPAACISSLSAPVSAYACSICSVVAYGLSTPL
jgi:hypothetical protein